VIVILVFHQDLNYFMTMTEKRGTMAPRPRLFASTVAKTHKWIKEVNEQLQLEDPHKAYLILRGVLHVLRDRLTVNEAVDLSAQLPMLIRGFYFEGWSVEHKPLKIHTEQEFLECVMHVIPSDVDAVDCVKVVFKLLQQQITEGEIHDIKSVLPDRILKFWPKEGDRETLQEDRY
jgi:uncharacterized protein (DUF2267 family)